MRTMGKPCGRRGPCGRGAMRTGGPCGLEGEPCGRGTMRTRGSHAGRHAGGEPCGRRATLLAWMLWERRGQQHFCCMDDCFCHADAFLPCGRGFLPCGCFLPCGRFLPCGWKGRHADDGVFVVQRYKIKGGSDENYTVNFSES